MKKALITGITGQDGSFLAEFLLEKGYDVHGTIRRSSVDYRERIAHLEGKPHFHLHYADLGDSMSIIQVVNKVRPDEIYNLAAQSHVQVSFDSPEFTADVDATGVLRVLEAVRQCGLAETCTPFRVVNRLLGGLLGLLKAAILLFLLLAVCSWIPVQGLHDFLSSTAIVGPIFRSDWFAAATSYAISGQWFNEYISQLLL